MDTPLQATERANDPRRAIVAQVIANARPDVQRDGGDIELVSIIDNRIRVRLTGACVRCPMAGHTLGALRRQMTPALNEPVRVLPG